MLEQVKTEWDYNYLLQCLKKLALSTQHFRIKLWSIHIKIYFQSFASTISTIYHLCHLCVMIYKSIFYNWDITLNYWSICEIINIRRNFMSKWLWGPSMWLIYIYIYIYIYIQWSQLPPLLAFSYSNVLIVLANSLVPRSHHH